jgi:hypothetical protein
MNDDPTKVGGKPPIPPSNCNNQLYTSIPPSFDSNIQNNEHANQKLLAAANLFLQFSEASQIESSLPQEIDASARSHSSNTSSLSSPKLEEQVEIAHWQSSTVCTSFMATMMRQSIHYGVSAQTVVEGERGILFQLK